MTKDLLEAVLNDEQGCPDCVEENYLQTNEYDKGNTELKDDCKKMYREWIDLTVNKWQHNDLKTEVQCKLLVLLVIVTARDKDLLHWLGRQTV